jgi:hypothetical protein
MEIAIRDKRLLILKKEVLANQQRMIQQFDEVKQIANENKLLEGVLSDYLTFYRDMLLAKRQQEQQLVELRDYLEQMRSIIGESNEELAYLKEERMKTIGRLDNVRQEIKNLLDLTENGGDYDERL